MKNQNNTVWAPALAALALALVGCGHPEVLADRPYIPAPESDVYVPEGRTAVMPATRSESTTVLLIEEEVETSPAAAPASDSGEGNASSAAEPSASGAAPYRKFVGTPGEPRVNSGPRQQTVADSSAVAGDASYVVRKGDSLSVIAQRHGVKTVDLAAVNGLTLDSKIKVGQKLKLPAGAKTSSAAPTAAPATAAKKSGEAAGSVKSTTPAAIPADGLYTVQKNDSLWLIARRFDTTVAALCELNNITPDKKLQVGQKLKVAKSAAAPASTPAPAATTAPTAAAPASTPAPAATTAPAAAAPAVTPATPPATPSAPVTAEPTAPAVTPPATQPAAEPASAPAAAAPVKPATQTMVLQQDTSVDVFCRLYKVDPEDLKRLNPDLDLSEGTILRRQQRIVTPAM